MVLLQDSEAFFALQIIVGVVFTIGMIGNVAFWLKGAPAPARPASVRAVIAALAGGIGRLLNPPALADLLLDWLLQRRIWRLSRLRWVMHMGFLWGMVLLFFVGSVGLMLTERGVLSIRKDDSWFGLINDFGGTIMVVAVAIAISRRLILKERQLRTGPEDVMAIALLAVIVVTGFLLEASRLIAEQVPGAIGWYRFVGYPLSLGLRKLSIDWAATETTIWWAHVVLGMSFVAYLPYGKFFHIFATPLSIAANAANRRSIVPAPSGTSAISSSSLPLAPIHRFLLDVSGLGEGLGEVSGMSTNNFTTKQLLEFDACSKCGECIRHCQAYQEKPLEDIAPAVRLHEFKAMLKSKLGVRWLSRLFGGVMPSDERLKEMAAGTFRCTLCARCAAVCPSKIDLRSLWISVRQELVDAGLQPSGLNMARDAIEEKHNVVNNLNEERAMWVDYMVEAPVDAYRRERADVVYFVGCIASFSPAVQSIPEAFVQLLSRAGVDFTILGEKEHCCGFPLLAAGMRREMEDLIEHNVAAVRATGASAVVFTCPSCYNTWMNEYQRHLPGVEMIHSTQYVERLLQQGRFRLGRLGKRPGMRITYHDPCDLGRNSGVYDSPRAVLEQIPEAEFVEVASNREMGLCCGGGGDLEISDPELASNEAANTVAAFEETGADVIVTACQQCKRSLQTAREKRRSKVEVLDLAELVFRVLEPPTPEDQLLSVNQAQPVI